MLFKNHLQELTWEDKWGKKLHIKLHRSYTEQQK